MINRKDLWLLVLILVVGAIVAIINPRFLSLLNLSNTANLVGLFGIFAVAQAFVIISGGIELSAGSVIALLGAIFINTIALGQLDPLLAVVVVLLHYRFCSRLSYCQDWASAICRYALRFAYLPWRRAVLHR